ncbi:MAG TPA: glycine cleavage system protein H [Ottowia sp.]|uniref:glycine cleavage system protein H n=1 Tax=Ottowia sp. TaxID=1898956 RepID=UPI002CCFA159|nr:glycine cleavage system protein H [Ottowia sp.]HMN20453.1 glycine cleavage system protein H [Ottowia sp.]
MSDRAVPPACPPELHYLPEHQVWARLEGDGTATVGITQLGIQLSGEIYMCRPKRPGTALAQGETVAVVELAKAIVPVKTPVSGTVIEGNPALEERPQLVHRDPFGTGWIARLQLNDFELDRPALLTGAAAQAATAEEARARRLELVPATTLQRAP